MIRLGEPQYSFEQALSECLAGITGNEVLRGKLTTFIPELSNVANCYIAFAKSGELYTLSAINTEESGDPVVFSDLTRSDFIKLYNQYFVPDQKPARRIYDALKNSAHEKCPFCGGIGSVKNLDHFLPKAHFPLFSVMPWNLIPACRDCNMDGMAGNYATVAGNQIIHPYADQDRFFSDQWIRANYHAGDNGEPGFFEYFVSAPDHWTDTDKERVAKHFKDFDLAKRFSKKAGELLGTILTQIDNFKNLSLSNKHICQCLLQPGVDKAPFVNHWHKGMYQALINSLPI